MSGRDRKIKTSIKYTSSNGFTGILYGESSMIIGKVQADGSFYEYLHTGSRNGNSIEYLKEMVDGIDPEEGCENCAGYEPIGGWL